MSSLKKLMENEYTLESDDNKMYSRISRPIIFFDVKPPIPSNVKFVYNRYEKDERKIKNSYAKEMKWDKELKKYIGDESNFFNMQVDLNVFSNSSKFKGSMKDSVVDNKLLYTKVFEHLQDVEHTETNDFFQSSHYIKRKEYDQYSYIDEVENSDIYAYMFSSENKDSFNLDGLGELNKDFIFKNKQSENVNSNSYLYSVSRQTRYFAFKNLYSLSFAKTNKGKKINEFISLGLMKFNRSEMLAKNSFLVELDSDWFLSSNDFSFSKYQMSKLSLEKAFGIETSNSFLQEVMTLIDSAIESGEDANQSIGSVLDSIKSYTGTSVNTVGYVIKRGLTNENEMSVVAIAVGDRVGNTVFLPSSISDQSISYGVDYVYSISLLVELQQSYFGSQGSLNFGRTYISGSPSKLLFVSSKDVLPPYPPKDFSIVFKGTRAILSWAFPNDYERKIKKFNIYKRKNINSPFSLLMQYDFRDWKGGYGETTEGFNELGQTEDIRIPSTFKQTEFPELYFEDPNFNFGDIYSITSVDAHENESNYSQQLSVVQSAGSFPDHRSGLKPIGYSRLRTQTGQRDPPHAQSAQTSDAAVCISGAARSQEHCAGSGGKKPAGRGCIVPPNHHREYTVHPYFLALDAG